jgi:hypothetical protein
MRVLIRSIAAASLTLAAATAGRAQQPLPSADQILARYHAAMGVAAFASVRSLHSVGELNIPAAGLIGRLEVWQARPNRTQISVSVPGFGDVHTGFTGAAGWAVDPVQGPRLMVGPEALQAQDDAHFDSHLRTSELVESITTIEHTTLAGHDCIKVRTVWKSARITNDCFSTETGLLVGSVRTHHDAGTGPADATILYEEYRQFGEVRLPTRITTRVNGRDQIITLRSVTLNAVPDSAFVLPDAVRALLRD